MNKYLITFTILVLTIILIGALFSINYGILAMAISIAFGRIMINFTGALLLKKEKNINATIF